MKTLEQKQVLDALGDLLDLIPDFRVGQLVSLCGDFSDLEGGPRLPDMDDVELLAVIQAKVENYRRVYPDRVPHAPLAKSA